MQSLFARVAVAAAIVILAPIEVALACSCAADVTAEHILSKNKWVARITVIGNPPISINDPLGPHIVANVEWVYESPNAGEAGKAGGPQTSIKYKATGLPGGADCSYLPRIGTQYVVFGNAAPPAFEIDLCNHVANLRRNNNARWNELVSELGRLTKLERPTNLHIPKYKPNTDRVIGR